ncbi:MAG: hypothetical protein GY679_03280 [Mycoplasma sp.]|nr:hypothetical protein [Mycoplasma sp.]
MKQKLKFLLVSSVISSGIVSIPFVTDVYLNEYKNKNLEKIKLQDAQYSTASKDQLVRTRMDICCNKIIWTFIDNISGDTYSLLEDKNRKKVLWKIKHDTQKPEEVKYKGPDYSDSTIMQTKDGVIYVSLQQGNSSFKTGLYTINSNDWSNPKKVFESHNGGSRMGKTFQASDGTIFALTAETLKFKKGNADFVDITTKTLLVKSMISEVNGRVYIGNTFGIWRVEGTSSDEKSKKHNLKSINSDVSLDENSQIKNLDGKFYVIANPVKVKNKPQLNTYKDNKLYIFDEKNKKLKEIATNLKSITEITRIKDGRFIVVSKDGIYITVQKELNSSTTFKKLFDDEDKNEEGAKFTVSKKYDEYFYMANSNGLFKISKLKENDFLIIRWHKKGATFSNDMLLNTIQIDTELKKQGFILQYKNPSSDWKDVPKDGIIKSSVKGTLEFRWTPDSWNTHLHFSLGDGSGNTYTEEQVEWLKDKSIIPAPAGAKVGEKVTQANIDKRNKITPRGRPIPEKSSSKQALLWKHVPFGIDDDDTSDANIYRQGKTPSISIPLNLKLLEDGDLDLKFKLAIIQSDKVNPTLKDMDNIYWYGDGNGIGKAYKLEGYITLSWTSGTQEFHNKIHIENKSKIDSKWDFGSKDDRTTHYKEGQKQLPLWREGPNSKSNKMKVSVENVFKKTGSGMATLTLTPTMTNESGEDAVYFPELSLVTRTVNRAQKNAADASFEARKTDKIGHKYTKAEIWLRDNKVKHSEEAIVGLNKKNNREIKSITKIELKPKKFVDSKSILDQINIFITKHNSEDLFNKNFLNDELVLSLKVLGLDPKKFELVTTPKLHNGVNVFKLKILGDNIFENNKNIKEFKVDFKKWFFEIIDDKNLYKKYLFHLSNEVFTINNKTLGLDVSKITIDPTNTQLKWGANTINLIAQEGYMFSNKKKNLKVNVTVFKNSPEHISETLKLFKQDIIGSQFKQGIALASEVADEINNEDNLETKIKNLKKYNINLPLSIKDTRISDIFVLGNKKGDLELSLVLHTDNTADEYKTHNIKFTLKGKSNEIVADEVLHKDKEGFSKYLIGSKLKNQGFRLIDDVLSTITDSESLYLLLNKKAYLMKNSYLSKVSASVSSSGSGYTWEVNFTLSTKISMPDYITDTPSLKFTETFVGYKPNAEIKAIPIDKMDEYQAEDINQIKEKLDSEVIKGKGKLKVLNISQIHDVHSLKENTGIDLNMNLKASIIKKVEAQINKDNTLSITAYAQTHGASNQEFMLKRTFELSTNNNNSNTPKPSPTSFSLTWIIIISVISVSIVGIIIALFIFWRRRRFYY